ncbi:hypothetical protein [Rheinheimera sp. EpRS3]|uniref:hypothetical protein n=1 Tax=Rheinheimera sp. EpRS3 TaxID=1712383 RepID=UPI000748A2CE|nr:hypothetical protein [Rheinheimera sp. EpRS3]KUM53479.1 hypothetical protein AR688_06125 [Rheinheimera sp. EpRS3]
MKFLVILFGLLFISFAHANEGIDINKLREGSIKEIHKIHPNTKGNDLVFVDMEVETKSKKLAEIYIELSFVDKNSLHSDEYSKYAYDRYIVSFNIVSGRLKEVVKGGWGSYQPVDNDVLK